jgi:hypothetical protein
MNSLDLTVQGIDFYNCWVTAIVPSYDVLYAMVSPLAPTNLSRRGYRDRQMSADG